MLELLDHVDMAILAADVKPFLFNPEEVKRILLFKEFISSVREKE